MQSVYYNNLGANKRIYDAALQCFQNRGRSFPVTGSIQAAELAIEVLNDHPEIFYVGQEFRVMSSLMRRDIMPAYLYSPAEATKIRGQLDAAAQSIISEHINDHQSDYDKVRSLHDYLKSNLEYDTVAASSHRPNERNIAEAHNIIGALLKHKCVCEGFAKAFKFLCDKIDLECWVVSGKGSSSIGAGPHAWNIVKINGYYHHVDVTWDNQYSDSSSMPNYGYTREMFKEAEKKGFTQNDVSEILLVGGSSKMPQVMSRVKSAFGIETKMFDPDESVAKGAAIYANKMSEFNIVLEEIAKQQGKSVEEVKEQVDKGQMNLQKEAKKANIQMRGGRLPGEDVKIINVSSRSFGTCCNHNLWWHFYWRFPFPQELHSCI